MKNISRNLLIFSIMLTFVHCDKSPENPVHEPYAEISLDERGGSWKTYILANGNELSATAPEDASTAAYKQEIADLKSKMAAATDTQKELARLWGGNATARWHAIARDLAAQYNSAPKARPDGTYPVPDANNPTAEPRFPFANPPYTSRALALLSVAQYDGLVSAWAQKFKFNRKAPYKNDTSIDPLIPENDLPSYPSEDAVIAAASYEVLAFLFPGEKAYLRAQADEHLQSRLWAGANVQSDLTAGEALGKAVAAKIIAYAKTDNMGKANAQVDFPKMREDATLRGITAQWHSLEKPARPPLLPFFGNVKPWNFDETTKKAIRPAAPPAIGSPEFEANMAELRKYSKNPTREQQRITTFWADGTGSYTPPGHWNRLACEIILEKQLNEIRTARALALVSTAVQDAGISCWDIKYYYLYPRPTEVDPNITTGAGIPNFPAYTSGHSTFSSAGAEVLAYLFPDKAAEMRALAKEASESRIYGCIHYRFDCETGLVAGKKVAEYAIQRGKNDGAQ
jgi:hypothetical protein